MNKDPKYVPHEIQKDRDLRSSTTAQEVYVQQLLKKVDTPSTLEERFLAANVKSCIGEIGDDLEPFYELDNVKVLKFLKQELADFAEAVKKQITLDASEDIYKSTEQWDLGWNDSSKNSIQSIDHILKTRYGLMEGEKERSNMPKGKKETYERTN